MTLPTTPAAELARAAKAAKAAQDAGRQAGKKVAEDRVRQAEELATPQPSTVEES